MLNSKDGISGDETINSMWFPLSFGMYSEYISLNWMNENSIKIRKAHSDDEWKKYRLDGIFVFWFNFEFFCFEWILLWPKISIARVRKVVVNSSWGILLKKHNSKSDASCSGLIYICMGYIWVPSRGNRSHTLFSSLSFLIREFIFALVASW